jgi:hypothetical protein
MIKWYAVLGASLLCLACSDDGEPQSAPVSSEQDDERAPITRPSLSPIDGKLRAHAMITINDGCDVPAGSYHYPARSDQPVSGSSPGVGFTDGEHDADGESIQLECLWTGQTAPYSVALMSVSGRSTELRFLSASFTFNPATGDNVAIVLLTGGPVPNDETYGPAQGQVCSFDAKDVDPDLGSVWGEIRCDAFGSQTGQSSCVIGASYIAIENCRG